MLYASFTRIQIEHVDALFGLRPNDCESVALGFEEKNLDPSRKKSSLKREL